MQDRSQEQGCSLLGTHDVDAAADAAQLGTTMHFIQPHIKSTAFGNNKAGAAIYVE